MRSGRVDLVAVLLLICGVNVLASAVSNDAALGALHISAATLAVGGARLRGYTADDLALSPRAVGDGIRLGAATAAIVLVGVVTVAVVPTFRQFLSDDRFAQISDGEVLYETLFRIPVITAFTEELLFRSVLLGILLTLTTTRAAIVVHAVVFGLWHVLTTFGDLSDNAVTDSFAAWGRMLAVGAAVLATGAAGGLFGWLRVRSASVVAPWIAHVSFNAGTFLAGVVVVRNGWV